jgi:hypothetical protein
MTDFFGIDVKGEGPVVQDWYDRLIPEAQDEILNLALHLARLPMGLWHRPDFDPLEGEGGISELRPKDIRSDSGNATYRIYGWRGYPKANSYTFLHGTDKEEKNDFEGKEQAKWRAKQLFEGRAQPHKFDF